MRGGGGQIYVFYHIFCNPQTLNVVRDQVMKMIYSGLYRDAKQIYCFLTGDAENVKKLEEYIGTLPSKFKIEKKGVGDTTFERFTLGSIRDLVTDQDRFLYMHSKGVTRMHENNYVSECITLWRGFMEYYLIALYKKCLAKLADHDIVGVLHRDEKIGDHFSGNFWWSTGKYFRQLCKDKAIGTEYYDAEAYIFKGSPKYYAIDHGHIDRQKCLYSTPLVPKLYVDKDPI